jgi:DNA polymerase III epsilon subunit-like protein
MDLAALSDLKLPDLSFVAFDTEATGYSNVSDRLVEIAGERFRWRDGVWVTESVLEELVHPGRPIPAEVVAIHGLTDADVADAAPAVEALDRFFAFAHDALLMVHYAAADVGMMAFAYVRAGRVAPEAFVLDTWPLSHKLVPGLRNYALDTLAGELALPLPTHRALPDARTTRELFEHCVGRLGKPAEISVGELFAVAGPPLTLAEFAALPIELPEALAPIARGLAERRDVVIEYRGGSKGRAPRRVTPSHLFARQGRVFLEGYCHMDREMKSFRLDRIEGAALAEGEPGPSAMSPAPSEAPPAPADSPPS